MHRKKYVLAASLICVSLLANTGVNSLPVQGAENDTPVAIEAAVEEVADAEEAEVEEAEAEEETSVEENAEEAGEVEEEAYNDMYAEGYGVSIDGEYFNSMKSSITNESGGKFYYDRATNTVTVDSHTFTSVKIVGEKVNGKYTNVVFLKKTDGVIASDSIVCEDIGDFTMEYGDSYPIVGKNLTIFCAGDVKITGANSLTQEGKLKINGAKDVTIDCSDNRSNYFDLVNGDVVIDAIGNVSVSINGWNQVTNGDFDVDCKNFSLETGEGIHDILFGGAFSVKCTEDFDAKVISEIIKSQKEASITARNVTITRMYSSSYTMITAPTTITATGDVVIDPGNYIFYSADSGKLSIDANYINIKGGKGNAAPLLLGDASLKSKTKIDISAGMVYISSKKFVAECEGDFTAKVQGSCAFDYYSDVDITSGGNVTFIAKARDQYDRGLCTNGNVINGLSKIKCDGDLSVSSNGFIALGGKYDIVVGGDANFSSSNDATLNSEYYPVVINSDDSKIVAGGDINITGTGNTMGVSVGTNYDYNTSTAIPYLLHLKAGGNINIVADQKAAPAAFFPGATVSAGKDLIIENKGTGIALSADGVDITAQNIKMSSQADDSATGDSATGDSATGDSETETIKHYCVDFGSSKTSKVTCSGELEVSSVAAQIAILGSFTYISPTNEINNVWVADTAANAADAEVYYEDVDGEGYLVEFSELIKNETPFGYVRIAANHVCDDYAVDVEQVDATCVATGTTAGTVCDKCGKVLSGVEEIPVDPDAHDYVLSANDSTAPYAETDGNNHYICSYDESHTKNEAVPVTIYKIVKGDNSSEKLESGVSIIIASEAEFADFLYVKVDDKLVDASNFAVTSGSTVVTLKPEFLNTLAVGKHTLKIVSKAGYAVSTFEILAKDAEPAKNEEPSKEAAPAEVTPASDTTPSTDTVPATEKSPKTGDPVNVAFLFASMLSGGLGAVVAKRKKKH